MFRKVISHLLPPLPSAPWRWLPPPLPQAAGGGWHRITTGALASASASSAVAYDGCYVPPVLTPFGYRFRTVNVCG